MLIDKGNYKLYKGACLEVMDGLIIPRNIAK